MFCDDFHFCVSCRNKETTNTVNPCYLYSGGKHNKPHVHVEYGEYEASVGIDGEVLAGILPEKQYGLVSAWLTLHEDELY